MSAQQHDPVYAYQLGEQDYITYGLSIPFVTLNCRCQKCVNAYNSGQENQARKERFSQEVLLHEVGNNKSCTGE